MSLRLAAPLLLLIAACACSPQGAPAAPENAQGVEAAAPAKGEAKSGFFPAVPQNGSAAAEPAASSASAPRQVSARRCGWLSNPTPANWWLTDRDGEWILATQGADQAPGMDEMPDMSVAGWEETNGHYGYGCACMTLTVDPATRQVLRVADAQPKPLKQCRADRSLPQP